jgi:hypothetical protein
MFQSTPLGTLSLVVTVLASSTLSRAAPNAQTPLRHVEGQRLISVANPSIEVRVGESFRYLGHADFIIKEMAQAELHLFVEATPDNRIHRMIVIQFEGFLPGQHHGYDAPVTSPRRLGGSTYDVTSWHYNQAADAQENPKGEAAETRRFLSDKGFTFPDSWLMGRYARTIGSDLQHELLLFYLESSAADASVKTSRLDAEAQKPLIARAERAFTLSNER